MLCPGTFAVFFAAAFLANAFFTAAFFGAAFFSAAGFAFAVSARFSAHEACGGHVFAPFHMQSLHFGTRSPRSCRAHDASSSMLFEQTL